MTGPDDQQSYSSESAGWASGPAAEPPATEAAGQYRPYYPSGQFAAEDYSAGQQPPAGPAASYPAPGYSAPEYPAPGYSAPEYPAPGYSTPGYPAPGYPGGDYATIGYPPAEPPHRRRRLSWILGGAVAVLLLLVGGGAVAAYRVLNGGGTQPDQVVPANVVAFAKLDLNPSASQKIAAARFLHRIPKLGSGFTGSRDWRQAMFEALSSDGDLPAGVDYNRDVKPWLGKRAAIAVLPTLKDGDPEVLLVFQSTDDGKARAGIARFGSDNGVSFYHGYAVVAEDQQIADQAVASAKSADLAGSAHYQADLKQLGSLGIASGWADLGAAGKLATFPAGSDTASGKLLGSGRLAFTVRMTSNSADLIGKFYGLSGPASVAAPDLGGLPATSAVAFGAGVDGAAIDRMWKQYSDLLGQFGAFSDPDQPQLGSPSDALDSLQQQFGVRLPDDLKTLLGSGISVSVEAHGLAGGGDTPKFVVQTRTNGPAANRVMDNIRHALENEGADFPISYRATPTGLLVASDPDYLAAVNAGSSPKLSGVSSFRQALPDRSGATETGFVNLDAIAAEMRAQNASADDLKSLEAFSAVGLTAKVQGGTATLHIRLLAH